MNKTDLFLVNREPIEKALLSKEETEEHLQVIEKSSEKTLFIPQSLPLSPDYIYEGIVVFIWDYSQVLFQIRSKTKSLFPGMYDASVTGHMTQDDHGSPTLTAIREITEELDWNPLTKSSLIGLGQVDDHFLITNPKTKKIHTLTQRAHTFALHIDSIQEIFSTREQFSEEVETVIGKSLRETQQLRKDIPKDYVPRTQAYQKLQEYFESIGFPDEYAPIMPTKEKNLGNTFKTYNANHKKTPLTPLFPRPKGEIIPLFPERALPEQR